MRRTIDKLTREGRLEFNFERVFPMYTKPIELEVYRYDITERQTIRQLIHMNKAVCKNTNGAYLIDFTFLRQLKTQGIDLPTLLTEIPLLSRLEENFLASMRAHYQRSELAV